jgi:hypothetical protein
MSKKTKQRTLRTDYVLPVVSLLFFLVGVIASFKVGTYADAEGDSLVARYNFGHLFAIESFLEGYQKESKTFVASYGSSVTFLIFGPIWLIGKSLSSDFTLVTAEAIVARNIFTFTISLLGLYCVSLWYRLLFNKGPLTVFLAAPFVIPVWFGMSFMNSKDIPLATGFASLIALFAIVFDRDPKSREKFLRLKIVSLTHIAVIMTIGVRPISAIWILPPIVFMIFLQARKKLESLKPVLVSCFTSLIYIVSTNYFLITEPIFWIKNVFGMGDSFPWTGAVLSWGELYRAPQIPRTYTFEILSSQVPLLVFSVLVIGIFSQIHQSKKLKVSIPLSVKVSLGLLVLVLVQTLVQSPVLYDNARQLLFLHILIFIVFLWAFEISRKMISRNLFAKGALIVFACLATIDGVKLFPYNYIYRNEIARQMPAGSFETDYWGLSGKEISNWVIRDSLTNDDESATVAYLFPQSFSSYIKNSKLISVPSEDLSARYYAQIWRPGLLPDYSAQCPIAYSVSRSFILGKSEILGYVRKCR